MNYSSIFFRIIAIIVAIAVAIYPNIFPKSIPDRYDELLPLHQIDRILESQLNNTTFYSYIEHGIPLIIVRDVTGKGDKWKNLPMKLVSNCGNMTLSAIPKALRVVLKSLNPWQFYLYAMVIKLAINVDLSQWIDEREEVTLEEAKFAAAYSGVEEEVKVEKRATSTDNDRAGEILPKSISRMLTILTLPMYMAYDWSRNTARNCGIPFQRTSAETGVLKELEARGHLTILRFANPMISIFWGGTGTTVYPLHLDFNDNDVMIDVYEGCKELVIVHPDERHYLTKLSYPRGAMIWLDDFFDHGRPASMEKIWRGVVHSGETIFFPSDSIHEARNQCPNTLSICTRPWVGEDVRKNFWYP